MHSSDLQNDKLAFYSFLIPVSAMGSYNIVYICKQLKYVPLVISSHFMVSYNPTNIDFFGLYIKYKLIKDLINPYSQS